MIRIARDVRDSLGRLALTFGALASTVVLADCTDAGGPSFITLGVDVTPVTAPFGTGGSFGTGGTVGTSRPADICVRLPVLLGSIVDKNESLSTGLGVTIHATRDGADVTFQGVENDDTARSFGIAELRFGIDETVVLSVDGEILEANITTGCTNP